MFTNPQNRRKNALNYHAHPPSLHTSLGQRKYLNHAERERFLIAAFKQDRLTCNLCLTLLYSGCRLSEALNITPESILSEEGVLLVQSLKKRGNMSVRQIPVPSTLLSDLSKQAGQLNTDPLWPWHRTWAWMRVKDTMAKANVVGPHASPRGLRHGFGVHAIQSGVPLNLIQKWLGHANIKTTAIYTDAVGPEERAMAERMW